MKRRRLGGCHDGAPFWKGGEPSEGSLVSDGGKERQSVLQKNNPTVFREYTMLVAGDADVFWVETVVTFARKDTRKHTHTLGLTFFYVRNPQSFYSLLQCHLPLVPQVQDNPDFYTRSRLSAEAQEFLSKSYPSPNSPFHLKLCPFLNEPMKVHVCLGAELTKSGNTGLNEFPWFFPSGCQKKNSFVLKENGFVVAYGGQLKSKSNQFKCCFEALKFFLFSSCPHTKDSSPITAPLTPKSRSRTD